MSIWNTKQSYETRSQREWYKEQARTWSRESIQRGITDWERIETLLQSQNPAERADAEMYVRGVWADDPPVAHVAERLALLRSLYSESGA